MSLSRNRITPVVKTFCVPAVVVAVVLSAGSVANGGVAPSPIDLTGQQLEFLRGSHVEVVDLPYLYSDILPSITDPACLQARLALASSSNVVIDDADDYNEGGPTPGIFVDLEGRPNTSADARAEFRVEFLYNSDCSGDDGIPVSVQNLCVTIRDIDGYQFAEVSTPNSYVLSESSVLSVGPSSAGIRASAPSASSADDNEDHWFEVRYGQEDSITFAVGLGVPGNSTSGEFDVRFGCASWTGSIVQLTPSSGDYQLEIDPERYPPLSAESPGPLPNTL